MLWKKERGSYTVEAAFIVPMVLGIVFMILYLILWHHDRCVLQADLQDRVFLMAEKEKKESGPIEELQKKMWIMTIDKKEISSNALLIKGKVAAHSRVNIPLLTFMLYGSQKIELEETYPAKQPDEARRYRKKEEK